MIPNRFANLSLQPAMAGVTAASVQVISPGRYKFALLSSDLPSGTIATLGFIAPSNQISAIIPIPPQNLVALQNDGTAISNLFAQAGRVVIVAEQPVLDPELAAFGPRQLLLYGKVGSSYEIQSSSTLNSSNWTFVTRFPKTNISQREDGLPSPAGPIFFRSSELLPIKPLMDARVDGSGNRFLVLYARPGTTNTLQYSTNFSGVAAWYPVVDLNFTNSFRFVNGLSTNDPAIFYRLQAR